MGAPFFEGYNDPIKSSQRGTVTLPKMGVPLGEKCPLMLPGQRPDIIASLLPLWVSEGVGAKGMEVEGPAARSLG